VILKLEKTVYNCRKRSCDLGLVEPSEQTEPACRVKNELPLAHMPAKRRTASGSAPCLSRGFYLDKADTRPVDRKMLRDRYQQMRDVFQCLPGTTLLPQVEKVPLTFGGKR
jgi:hypothetical protein